MIFHNSQNAPRPSYYERLHSELVYLSNKSFEDFHVDTYVLMPYLKPKDRQQQGKTEFTPASYLHHIWSHCHIYVANSFTLVDASPAAEQLSMHSRFNPKCSIPLHRRCSSPFNTKCRSPFNSKCRSTFNSKCRSLFNSKCGTFIH